jgi:hypothetical protein
VRSERDLGNPHVALLALLGATLFTGCALSHARSSDAGSSPDAPPRDAAAAAADALVVPPDAAVPTCGAREEHVITPPPARRPRHHLLLQLPRASSDGGRVAALGLVVSDASGGLGVSDILTYAYDGTEPRAHFTSEVPYLLGSAGVPDEFLAAGGFTVGGRVYAESRRFDVTGFAILEADELGAAGIDRTEIALDPSDSSVPYVEVAREAPVAMRVSGRGAVTIHALGSDSIERALGPENVATYFPTPRLSPRGQRIAFARPGDRRTLHVYERGGEELTRVLDDEAAAFAFLGEDLVLVLGRARDGALRVLDLRDGSLEAVTLALPTDDERFFEGLDVSAGGETLVVSEATGERLRVVRCDASLMALARGS